MTTLVTGGTGFIGAELVRMLIARDEEPVVVTHRSNSFGRLAGVEHKVRFVPLDLADGDAAEQVITEIKPRRLFHFGAMLSAPGEKDPQALLAANVVGFMRTIEAARLAGVEQMIFASSIGTYARQPSPVPLNDHSVQRPGTIYGVSKVFGENLGAYYRARYGFDFRGIRYPSIVGPGVTTWSFAQYTSWMIENSIKGEPFEVWVGPESVVPILYYKDAARAALDLAAAPSDRIEAVSYLVNGPSPSPSASEMADAVIARFPGANITFDTSGGPGRLLVIDDVVARNEWDWTHHFDLEAMIDDMIDEAKG